MTPAAVRTALREALSRILGPETDDVLPEYPVRHIGELREIGKKGRPRLRRLFDFAGENDGPAADDNAALVRGVARACEDLLVALSGMEKRLEAVSARGNVDALAAKEALLRHPLVRKALAAAAETISRLSVVA